MQITATETLANGSTVTITCYPEADEYTIKWYDFTCDHTRYLSRLNTEALRALLELTSVLLPKGI